MSMQNKRFLGIGLRFPLALGDDGQLEMAYYEDAIRQSIWIILGTAPGERVMRPDFGCNIQNQVFAVDDATTRAIISDEVRRALIRWEPRIAVDAVTVEGSPHQQSLLLIQISYRVLLSDSRFNLVYPFYLES